MTESLYNGNAIAAANVPLLPGDDAKKETKTQHRKSNPRMSPQVPGTQPNSAPSVPAPSTSRADTAQFQLEIDWILELDQYLSSFAEPGRRATPFRDVKGLYRVSLENLSVFQQL
jgi:hypothetical protein